jgi:hypothetical protein
MAMQERDRNFEKLFVEAVDEGLNILSESGKQMVFFHLERDCAVDRQNISERSESFGKELEKIFGAGARVLEQQIIKNLYSKLGLRFEEKKGFSFEDYVKKARQEEVANSNP